MVNMVPFYKKKKKKKKKKKLWYQESDQTVGVMLKESFEMVHAEINVLQFCTIKFLTK